MTGRAPGRGGTWGAGDVLCLYLDRHYMFIL